MSLLSSIAKWKMRWALVSGAFTLIIWPLLRFLFKRKSAAKRSSTKDEVVDVKVEEIK